MVSRDRRFPTPHGYSRSLAKRDAEQLVHDELDAAAERSHRLARHDRGADGADRHIVLDLGPQVLPRRGIDLGAAVRTDPPPAEPRAPGWWQRVWRLVSWR
jgi:hypothetical protein